MKPRVIQREAMERIQSTIAASESLLVNMPCRSGKTFTTIYSCNEQNVELIVVLSGKASVKDGYRNDSAWLDNNGEKCGYDYVITNNDALKRAMGGQDPLLATAKKILIELTPQLLNTHPEYLLQLRDMMQKRKSVFVYDEAHFYAGSEDNQKQVDKMLEADIAEDEMVDDAVVASVLGNIPYIYLTASPDTQVLEEKFIQKNRYYELTKQEEWALYLEDLKKTEDCREFNYVPVRSPIYICDQILDPVFNAVKSSVQDFYGLFTRNTCEKIAKNFVEASLMRSIEIIVNGPEKEFMDEDIAKPYQMRGNQINLMIKIPREKRSKAGLLPKKLKDYIEKAKAAILEKYPQFTDIHIQDVTGNAENYSEKYLNEEFLAQENSINIILTKKRCIEGTTLPTLDGLLFWASETSLAALKQICGRVQNPAARKEFGFIFFFDDTGLSLVRMLITARKKYNNKNKNKGPKPLSEDDKKSLTRVSPTFRDIHGKMKLLDYNSTLLTKTDLEHERTRESLFDKAALFPDTEEGLMLKRMLLPFLGKLTVKSVTRKTGSGNEHAAKNPMTSVGSKGASEETPVEDLKIEKLVTTLIQIAQTCVQQDIDCSEMNPLLELTIKCAAFPVKAYEMMLNIPEVREVMMNIIYAATKDACLEQNPCLMEAFYND